MKGLDTARAILEWAAALGPRPAGLDNDDGETATYLAECVRLREQFEFEDARMEQWRHYWVNEAKLLSRLRDAMKGGAK